MARSINKPRKQIVALKHNATLARKRSARAKTQVPTRSSLGRYSDKDLTAPRPNDSKSIALYTGTGPTATGVLTNNILSKKRAQKLARNQKYINKRAGIDIDMDPKTKSTKESDLGKIKAALWNVIENKHFIKVDTDAEGTTLGVPTF